MGRARIFSGSLESAIYLLSVICSIPRSVSVLPAINSNFTHHISAGLANGDCITGQVNISHPSAPTALPDTTLVAPALSAADHDRIEDANLPGSLPALRKRQITFSKDDEEDLPARIERVWYINPYGHEIWPLANPKVLEAIRTSTTVIYSIGSLFTSIVPSLVLNGIGKAIAGKNVLHKILVLNAKLDRETGPRSNPMTARDFIAVIARTCGQGWAPETVDDLSKYVSHLLYLEGDGVPAVHVHELEKLGIQCIKVAGVRHGEGKRAMIRYDEVALGEALEAIIDS